MKPTISPELLNSVLRIVGTIMVVLGHSTAIPQPWAQLCGELGTAALLYTASKPGDIAIKELPKEVQDSVRPGAK